MIISPSTDTRGAEFSDYSLNLSHAYTRALLQAGGLPWVPPCAPDEGFVAEAVDRADGVMISGGDDLQPELYSSDIPADLRATVGRTDPPRDLFETLLICEAFKQRKPLLAICRGHQLMNVVFGGTLFIDIPTQVPGALKHCKMDKKSQPVHEAALRPNSQLQRILGTPTISVNSTHHQAVSKVADLFQAAATSPDGVIEALELKAEHAKLMPWLVSVQFHPERLIDAHPHFLNLFKSFVDAGVKNSKNL
ncbi:MAG TPA: gamma-glutamyl-gamma-aminobutyrate hydrolase family protein [Methylomirabilota bacterium]|nr:gamma-glutamyl-gamma-aminobutyrate hydrolase family protein [Methylomirabilota bacterium]